MVLPGCGYRPVALGLEATTKERPTLAIPLFDNRSTEIGLESVFANSFIEIFSRCKAIRLTSLPEKADLVLEGKIQSVAYSSAAFFNVNRPLVRRVTIRVEVQLTRRSTGKVIWKDSAILQEDHVADLTYQQGEALKDMSIRRGAATLAHKMLDKVLLVI
jgi:hypothetical protein